MLLKPLVSEKSMKLAKDNFYTFEVSLNSTKLGIRKLVSEKFKVDVLAVNTIRVHEKTKAQKSRRGYFTTSEKKKAIVQVAKGQKIALFESVAKENEEVTVTTGDTMPEVKEKKNLLTNTKVKIEKSEVTSKPTEKKEETDNSPKGGKKTTAKQRSIAKKKGTK